MRLGGIGEISLLATPMTAFFASRQCPGTAIRAAMAWAMQQAKAHQAVIGGFHSPLEQSVLHLLMEARSPVVAVLARPVADAQLQPAWKTAVAEGRMAVLSAVQMAERMTEELAIQRNDVAARLSECIVIAHAEPGGNLAEQSEVWASRGSPVLILAHCE